MRAHCRPRGGSRNRRDRVSDGLTAAQIHGLFEAAGHAKKIGLPFNRFVTVHWGALGLTEAEACRATGRFLKIASDAMRALGLIWAYVYVRENDTGERRKGPHVHILAHIPDAAARAGLLRRTTAWARLAAGGRYNRSTGRIEGVPYVAGAVRTLTLGGNQNVTPDVRDANIAGTLEYVAKGANPEAAERLGLPNCGLGGRIAGKRCGWSQNIGEKARREMRVDIPGGP